MSAIMSPKLDERAIDDEQIQQAVRFVEKNKDRLITLIGNDTIASFEEAIAIYTRSLEHLDYPDSAIADIAALTSINARAIYSHVEEAEVSEAEKAELKAEIDSIRGRIGKLENVKDFLEKKNAELEVAAFTDELTQTYNFKGLKAIEGSLFDRCREEGKPLSLLFLDLDHFKSVNDTYGHGVGDKVLSQFSKIVCETLRGYDVPFRGKPYGDIEMGAFSRPGGEEFIVLMPYSTLEEAASAAERIRKKLEQSTIDVVTATGEKLSLNITCSVGVSSTLDSDQDIKLSKEIADKALQEAKDKEEGGRNMVVVADRGEDVGINYKYYSEEKDPDRKIIPKRERGEKIKDPEVGGVVGWMRSRADRVLKTLLGR